MDTFSSSLQTERYPFYVDEFLFSSWLQTQILSHVKIVACNDIFLLQTQILSHVKIVACNDIFLLPASIALNEGNNLLLSQFPVFFLKFSKDCVTLNLHHYQWHNVRFFTPHFHLCVRVWVRFFLVRKELRLVTSHFYMNDSASRSALWIFCDSHLSYWSWVP